MRLTLVGAWLLIGAGLLLAPIPLAAALLLQATVGLVLGGAVLAWTVEMRCEWSERDDRDYAHACQMEER